MNISILLLFKIKKHKSLESMNKRLFFFWSHVVRIILTLVRLHILKIRFMTSQSIEHDMHSTWMGPYRSIPSSGQYCGQPCARAKQE